MSKKSQISSTKNYKIISNHFSYSPILIKKNVWAKQSTQTKNNHLTLYKPCGFHSSKLFIYNRITRCKIKILHKPITVNISRVLHLPNTSHLILWSDEDSLNLSLWNIKTNQQTQKVSLQAALKLILELNLQKNDASEFVTLSIENLSSPFLQVKFWNSYTFDLIKTFRFDNDAHVLLAQINHYAQKLVAFTFSHYGIIKIYDLASKDNRELNTLRLDSNTSIECLLIRKVSVDQFVTIQKTWTVDRRNPLNIYIKFYRVEIKCYTNVKKCLYSEETFDFNKWSTIRLFDMNANEFGSLNQASGLVKVWCWKRGVCLKKCYIFLKNINTQNIYSYVIDSQNEMIIFIALSL